MARTKRGKNPMVYAVVFCIVGCVFLFQGVRNFIGISGKLLNISTCDSSEVQKGEWIEANLTIGYGAYVETQSKSSRYGSYHTDGYYYLVDVCDKNEDGSYKDDGYRYIGVKIGASDLTDYDNLSDEAPLKITGVVKKNSNKVQGYLEDYLKDMADYICEYYGYSASASDYEQIYAEAFPYYIEVIDKSDCKFDMVIGGIFLVIGVAILLIALSRKKNMSYSTAGAYGDASTYGSTDNYAQPNTYGSADNYAQPNTYGGTDSYAQPNTYGGTDNYAQPNTYGSSGTYGQPNMGGDTAPQTPYSDPFAGQNQSTGSDDSDTPAGSSGFSLKKDL